MSFTSDILPLIGSIIGIVVVLYLTYIASKYLSKKVSVTSTGGNIKIVERIALAQDKMLAVTEVCGKYYLIGVSSNNINLLKELPDYTPPKEELNVSKFTDVFKKVGKTK